MKKLQRYSYKLLKSYGSEIYRCCYGHMMVEAPFIKV